MCVSGKPTKSYWAVTVTLSLDDPDESNVSRRFVETGGSVSCVLVEIPKRPADMYLRKKPDASYLLFSSRLTSTCPQL